MCVSSATISSDLSNTTLPFLIHILMSSFSYPLGDDTRDLSDLINRAFPTGPGLVPPPTSSSTAVIPEIHRPFVSDPVRAVIDGIPPIEDPEDIRRWDATGRIPRFVEHQQAIRERQQVLEENPLYLFGQRVDSLLNTGDRPELKGVQIFVQPSNPEYQPADSNQPAFRLREHTTEADYQYGRAVNTALQQPETTGVVKLSNDTMAGVEKGLVALQKYNAFKFHGAKLEMFLKNSLARILLASLTAACITNVRVKNPTDYRKDNDWARSVEEINTCVKDMSALLERVDGEFVGAEPEKVNKNFHGQLSKAVPSSSSSSSNSTSPFPSTNPFAIKRSGARRKY